MPRINRFYRRLVLMLMAVTGLALAGFEYWLEHDRPQKIDGPFMLYHKGYGAIVYVSTLDQVAYLALGLTFIALAATMAFLSIDFREPGLVRRSR